MNKISKLTISTLLALQFGCASQIKELKDPTSIDVQGSISEDLESKLDFIKEVKKFGVEHLGLQTTKNYTTYREPKDARTLYMLHAVPETYLGDDYKFIFLQKNTEFRKTPKGALVFQSFKDNLKDETEFYDKTYDVYRRCETNFNDGKGADITPKFLKRTLMRQASTILHEDWHETYRKWNNIAGDVDIDESAAVIVGNIGAIEFAKYKYGKKSTQYLEAVKKHNDWKEYAEINREAFDTLKAIYNSNIPQEKKLEKKEQILYHIRWSEGYLMNNATLLQDRPYTEHIELLEDVLQKSGGVREFIQVMKQVPRDEELAVKYLKRYIKYAS